jgi:hypothetical protein
MRSPVIPIDLNQEKEPGDGTRRRNQETENRNAAEEKST